MKKRATGALVLLLAIIMLCFVSCAKEETEPEAVIKGADAPTEIVVTEDPSAPAPAETDATGAEVTEGAAAPKTYKAVEDGLLRDAFSYAYGYGMMQQYMSQGLVFPGGWFARGCIDLLTFNENLLIPPEEIPEIINNYIKNWKGEGDIGMPIHDVFLTLQWGNPATEHEKFGYCFGVYTALELLDKGIELDAHDFPQGVIDMLYEREPLIPVSDMAQIIEDWVAAREAELSAMLKEIGKDNRAKAEAKLAEVAAVEGNIVVSDKLVIEPVKMSGHGRRAEATDTVRVNYKLTDIDGNVLDGHDGADFPLEGVIPGFSQTILQMHKGDKVKAYVHPDLGYGEMGGGPIPPEALLIFEVEFVNVIN